MTPLVAYMPFILGALPFIVSIVVIIVLFRYLLGKKQLEHQQIMAAIEKGTPLSELRSVERKGANWVRSLTTGVACLLIGIGLGIVSLISFNYPPPDDDASFGLLIAAMVFFAIGAAGILRGILQRKVDKEKSALDAKNGQ